MTRQEVIFIIGLNAVVSLVISLLVVWFLMPQPAPLVSTPQGSASTVTPLADAPSMPENPAVEPSDSSATPGPPVHVVQAGETLFWIAQRYGVLPESIMEENDLEDPDILAIGQQLIIPTPKPEPSIEATVPEPSPTATESNSTPTPESTVTPALAEFDLAITNVIARGRREAEVLVLTNNGRDVHLQGWTLSNGQGQVYTFPNLTLFSGNSIRLYSTDGRNTPSDLYWGLESAAWGSGVEAAILKDPDGEVWATRELG
jgi:LysM repeat protein